MRQMKGQQHTLPASWRLITHDLQSNTARQSRFRLSAECAAWVPTPFRRWVPMPRLPPSSRRRRTLLANATGRRKGWGHMAPARGATTMIRRGLATHSCHGSGRACPCHARLHHTFYSPAGSAGGARAKRPEKLLRNSLFSIGNIFSLHINSRRANINT